MGLLDFFSRRTASHVNKARRRGFSPRHRLARLEPLEQRTLLSVGPVLDADAAHTIGAELHQLYQDYESAGGQLDESPRSVTLDGDRVAVHVTTRQAVSGVLEDLKAVGFDVTAASGHLATGWLPIDSVDEIASRSEFIFCARPAYSVSERDGDFAPPEAGADPLGDVVGATLAVTYREYDPATADFNPTYSIPVPGGDTVLVEVHTTLDDLPAFSEQLQALGMRVSEVDGSLIAGSLPIEGLDELAALDGVRWARPWRGANVELVAPQLGPGPIASALSDAPVDAVANQPVARSFGFFEPGWRFDGEYYWHIPGTPFMPYEEPADCRNLGPGEATFLMTHPPVEKVRVPAEGPNHHHGFDTGWNAYSARDWGITTTSGLIDVWWGDRTLYATEDRDPGKHGAGTDDPDGAFDDHPGRVHHRSWGRHGDGEFTNASGDDTYIAYFSEDPGYAPSIRGYWVMSNGGSWPAPGTPGSLGARTEQEEFAGEGSSATQPLVLDSSADGAEEGEGNGDFYSDSWRFDGEYYRHISGRPFYSGPPPEEPIDGTNLAPGEAKFLFKYPPVDKAIVRIPFGGEQVPAATSFNGSVVESLPDSRSDLSSINLRDYISLPDEPIDATNLAPGEAIFLGAGPPPDELRLLVPFNVNAADTTNTDQIQPNGGLGLNLQGNGYTVGVWEEGLIRATHQELEGRVTVVESGTVRDHATHVAGTIGASGVDAGAEGMATEVNLRSYTWDDDFAEMDRDASLMQVSNHSYGATAGWDVWPAASWGITTTSGTVDVWWEDRTLYSVEDRDFGKYQSDTAVLDDVLYNNLELLSVWAAGNDRNDVYVQPGASLDNAYVAYFSQSPPGGTPTVVPGYWLVANSGEQSAPPGDGNGGTGFDSLPPEQVAKNSLVVGAISDITADPYSSGNISLASFSNYGPTDDGRIRPDVVANGIELYSSWAGADDDYRSSSGTSMAAPNVSGTAILLIEHFEDAFEFAPRSATTKGLLIHTAFDAGNVGPDYSYGWGLVNAADAATFLTGAAAGTSTEALFEASYAGQEVTQEITSTGTEPIKATIVWTDPAGTAHGSGLDETTSVLVNDLDIWVTGPGGTYYPWTLDPANPSASAVQNAANHVDNVEQVLIAAPTAGTYTIHVGHTGSVTGQDFSTLVSGASLVTALVIDADDPGGNGRDNAQDDSFVFTRIGAALEIYINGNFSRSVPVAPLATITVNGSGDNDTTTLNALGSDFDGQVTVNRGSGGQDVAHLYGSDGNDSLVFGRYGDRATLDISDAYSVTVNDVRYVYAYATTGSTDLAQLYDEDGAVDTFEAHPEWADVKGDGYRVRADSFRYVHSYGTVGDNDVALLHDKANSDDTFEAWPDRAKLYGDDFFNRAKNFRYVHAYGTPGEWGVALLHDKANSDDTFEAWPDQAKLYGDDFFNRAKDFRYVHAYGTPGEWGVAFLYGEDSVADTFKAWPDQAKLYSDSFFNRAKNFRYVHAYGGDEDKAYFNDSTADDYFEAKNGGSEEGNDWAQLRDAADAVFEVWARGGFGYVEANSGTGDYDTTDIDDEEDLDFVLKMTGDWEN